MQLDIHPLLVGTVLCVDTCHGADLGIGSIYHGLHTPFVVDLCCSTVGIYLHLLIYLGVHVGSTKGTHTLLLVGTVGYSTPSCSFYSLDLLRTAGPRPRGFV